MKTDEKAKVRFLRVSPQIRDDDTWIPFQILLHQFIAFIVVESKHFSDQRVDTLNT